MSRSTISTFQLFQMFPDEDSARGAYQRERPRLWYDKNFTEFRKSLDYGRWGAERYECVASWIRQRNSLLSEIEAVRVMMADVQGMMAARVSKQFAAVATLQEAAIKVDL